MWDAFALVEGNFSGSDFDLFVDLDRITVDYLAVDFEGDLDAERALARRCWTDDRKHANEYNQPEENEQYEAGE